MILRSGRAGDAEAMAEVQAAAFEVAWSAADIRRFAGDRGGLALVAEADGALVGFILCRAIAGEAEILTLAVRPEHRRRGVARALVEGAAALATASADALFLEVADDNAGALALYRELGFVAAGRRAGYYGRPAGGAVDAIIMRRPLNS